jgi:hypothetical protein
VLGRESWNRSSILPGAVRLADIFPGGTGKFGSLLVPKSLIFIRAEHLLQPLLDDDSEVDSEVEDATPAVLGGTFRASVASSELDELDELDDVAVDASARFAEARCGGWTLPARLVTRSPSLDDDSEVDSTKTTDSGSNFREDDENTSSWGRSLSKTLPFFRGNADA